LLRNSTLASCDFEPLDDEWFGGLFRAQDKWFDLLVLARNETNCLEPRSRESRLFLSSD